MVCTASVGEHRKGWGHGGKAIVAMSGGSSSPAARCDERESGVGRRRLCSARGAPARRATVTLVRGGASWPEHAGGAGEEQEDGYG